MVVKSIVGLAFVFASVLSLACGSAAPAVEVTAAPEGAAIEISELVGQMRDMAWAEEVDAAQALIEQQRPHHDASSPAWLVAASWLGRGASFAERWDVAEQYAREAHDGSVALLDARALDAEGQLPTALGAGIEVLGHVLDAAGDRTGAVGFLAAQRERYRGTSIETRIQKNALLLGLEGQPFPVLDVEHYLGAPLPSADSLKGMWSSRSSGRTGVRTASGSCRFSSSCMRPMVIAASPSWVRRSFTATWHAARTPRRKRSSSFYAAPTKSGTPFRPG